MGLQTTIFRGLNVELIQVQMDVAETSYNVTHGLQYPYVPILIPSQAPCYSQAMYTDTWWHGYVNLRKTAGAAAGCLLLVIAWEARQFG